jgi:hypothetical protein
MTEGTAIHTEPSIPPPGVLTLEIVRDSFRDIRPTLPSDEALEALAAGINAAMHRAYLNFLLIEIAKWSVGDGFQQPPRGRGSPPRRLSATAYFIAARVRMALVEATGRPFGIHKAGGPVSRVGARLAEVVLNRKAIDPGTFASWVRLGESEGHRFVIPHELPDPR